MNVVLTAMTMMLIEIHLVDKWMEGKVVYRWLIDIASSTIKMLLKLNTICQTCKIPEPEGTLVVK